jgi:hypothetical protein
MNINKIIHIFIIFFSNISITKKIDELISLNGDFEELYNSKFKSIKEYKEFALKKFNEIRSEYNESIQLKNEDSAIIELNDTITHELKHLEEIIASNYILYGSFNFENITLEFYKDNIYSKGITSHFEFNKNKENPSIREFFISAAPLCPKNENLISTYFEISKAFINPKKQESIYDCGKKIENYYDSDIIKMINVIGKKFIFSINKAISKEIINKFIFNSQNKNNKTLSEIKQSILLLKNETNEKNKLFLEKQNYIDAYIINLIACFSNESDLNYNKEILNINIFLMSASETDKKYDIDMVFLENINKIFLEEAEIIINSLDEKYIKKHISSIILYKKFSKKLLYLILAKTCIKLLFIGEKENNGIYSKNTLMKEYPKTYQMLHNKIKENTLIIKYVFKKNKKSQNKSNKSNKSNKNSNKNLKFKLIKNKIETIEEIKSFLISRKDKRINSFDKKTTDYLTEKIERINNNQDFYNKMYFYFGIIKFANTTISENNCNDIRFIS